jgi:hypothetical protein
VLEGATIVRVGQPFSDAARADHGGRSNHSMTNRIAFVGGGNMATGLIGGLIARGTPPSSIVVADPEASQRSRLEHDYGVTTVADAPSAVVGARTVVLAVNHSRRRSPLDRGPVACRSSSFSGRRHRLQDLALAGPGVPLVRTMPNRPADRRGHYGVVCHLGSTQLRARQPKRSLAACGRCGSRRIAARRRHAVPAVVRLFSC